MKPTYGGFGLGFFVGKNMKSIAEILKEQKYPEAFRKRHGKKTRKQFMAWLNK